MFKEQFDNTYNGNWDERENNSNIEESYLGSYLLKQGYSVTVLNKAIYELKQVSDSFGDDLYVKNKSERRIEFITNMNLDVIYNMNPKPIILS